jgi:uncharacterized membrane protein
MTAVTAAEPGEPSVEARVAAREARVPMPSAWAVLVAGVVGLVASVTLTVEKIELLLNPAYKPSCNLNPILSCGSVMITRQASVLGFPNSLLGIVAFTVVLVTGVLAVAKVALPQWYWVGLWTGTLIGTGFVHWLIFQSLYRIAALCPYCMVVWVVTISLLVVVTSIVGGPLLDGLPGRTSTVARGLYQLRWSIATLWFTAVFLLIMAQFWDYWSTLL